MMDLNIELYRGTEYTYFGTIPFMPLLKESVANLLGFDSSLLTIRILIINVPEETPVVPGFPIVEHLMTEFGYAYIKVYEGESLVYQHPHPISDIITVALQKRLRDMQPQEGMWSFRLDIPGMPPLSTRIETPAVEGSMIVSEYTRSFNIRRVEPDIPLLRSLADYGIASTSKQSHAKVKVVLPERIERALLITHPFSWDVEEGGFLTGSVYLEHEEPGSYIVEIADMPLAQHTGASLLHFTFTGDSFAEVKRMLRNDVRQLRLVGWYHTHLFPATDTFGLSSIDVKLHFTTFTNPWQLAGLVNLDNNSSKRTLRFYIGQQDKMVLCPHWIIDENIQRST